MYQGQSTFSGRMIPKGSGISKVCNDGRVVLLAGGKEKHLYLSKTNPRDVKWTETSRNFYKKSHKTFKKHEQSLFVIKKPRGYNGISKVFVNEKTSSKNADNLENRHSQAFDAKNNTEKVGKHANLRK